MKYFLLIPAIILDFVQFMLGWIFIALQFATPAGGAVGGVITAGAYCWSTSSGIISGIISTMQCAAAGGLIGAGLSAFATPVGAAIDVALSLTIGGGIILLLAFEGMFYPKIIISRFLGEAMPFFNFLPIWTNMVWKCIREKQKEELAAGTVGQAWSFVKAGGEGPYGLKHNAELVAQRRFTERAVRRFSDIRPAARGAALALLLFVGVSVHAQTVPAPVQYIVAPEAPGAHETVIIEAQGVGSFLGSADITWSKDGVVVKEGIGERTYTFTTGALGERTVVRAAINSSQGFFTQTFSFNPSRINLVWEADTTVPLLYKGKALYSAGSNYKVVAFPTVYSGSSRVSPNALSYQWIYRGEGVPEASGLGRTIFSRAGDQLQPSEDIAVDVYYGVNKVGRAELSIPATQPFILFYQRDALRGALYDAALPAAISLTAKEITLQAEAFYFSAATAKTGLIPFVWTLGDAETSGPDSARGILTLRQTGSGKGSAEVGLSMQNNNPDQLVQSAKTSLQLVFGAEQGNALFNFIGI